MAAFAACTCAAVAFVVVFLGGRLTAAEESFVRTNQILRVSSNSEKEELTSKRTPELQRNPVEARQAVNISEERVERKSQEGKELSEEVIESTFDEDAGPEYLNSPDNVSKKLRQPLPGEKLHQHNDTTIVWSVEKKHTIERISLDSSDIPPSHNELNLSSPVESVQTKKEDPEVAVEDDAKGADSKGIGTQKETDDVADSAANPSDVFKQGINNSSENDASVDSSGVSLKHQSCCGDGMKLRACLFGAGAEELTLFVSVDDSFHISLKTPPFLMADRTEFELSSGQKESVKIHLVDLEAVRNVNSSEITLTYEAGICSIKVPAENLGVGSRQTFYTGFPYSTVTTPILGFGILLVGLALFLGIWLWCKYRGRDRHGDCLKYQELEMGHPRVVDHREEVNGWDEVWDDSWEDAEAATSSSMLTETLSSKGLTPRRSNKETWEKRTD